MPPKVLAKNADRTGGVLPVSAAARASTAKAPAARLKLEVRRLPPGLTLTEFEETLGEEWRLGNGKTDWREYRQGKIRTSGLGKVPEQSRCYLHVVSEACVKEFEARFLAVHFEDKAGTHKNPDLKSLPPTLGFAPNQRTPLQHPKQRVDNRQGTIDQDPEFIAFLEAETQPLVKPAALDTPGAGNEHAPVKTTPLIEDLRERKANKAKAAQAKAEKAENEKKTQTGKGSGKDAANANEKAGNKGNQHQKVEQAAKDAAKVLNKQAAAKQQQAQQSKGTPSAKSKKQAAVQSPKQQSATVAQPSANAGPPSPAPQRGTPSQRPKGNADGIKKMLQKDLGIRPKAAASNAASAASTASPAPNSAAASSTQQATPATAASPAHADAKPAANSTLSQEPMTPQTKAYLKHANPSQGMTEILIQQALSQFGELTNVTIDPRKGTAIAMFKQTDSLKKALEAKRVAVANGAVEILEFRERSNGTQTNRGGYRGGRGGRGGSRGGAQSGAAAATASTGAAAASS